MAGVIQSDIRNYAVDKLEENLWCRFPKGKLGKGSNKAYGYWHHSKEQIMTHREEECFSVNISEKKQGYQQCPSSLERFLWEMSLRLSQRLQKALYTEVYDDKFLPWNGVCRWSNWPRLGEMDRQKWSLGLRVGERAVGQRYFKLRINMGVRSGRINCSPVSK